MTKVIYQSADAEAYAAGSAAYFATKDVNDTTSKESKEYRQPVNPWREGGDLHAEWNAGYAWAECSDCG